MPPQRASRVGRPLTEQEIAQARENAARLGAMRSREPSGKFRSRAEEEEAFQAESERVSREIPEQKQSWLSRAPARNEPNRISDQAARVIPQSMRPWLSSRRVILGCWLASMAVISYDEWHNNGILPRPARLWWTSLAYGLLMAVSAIDAAVPIVNALAIGYTLMLIWQYYSSTGQFTHNAGS